MLWKVLWEPYVKELMLFSKEQPMQLGLIERLLLFALQDIIARLAILQDSAG
jgi:hypothetical protein